MKQAVLLLLIIISITAAYAQSPCDRPTYEEFVTKGQELVEAGDYIQAFQYYNSAKDYCQQESAAVDEQVAHLIAKIARDQQITKQAKEDAEDALLLAERVQQQAILSRQLAEDALAQAQKLTEAFYFYDDKFALAYGSKDYNRVFYFIDKNGDEVERLGRWDKAEQFDYYGYTKVRSDGTDFLLDTLGTYHSAAFNTTDLDCETHQAFYLNDPDLIQFPDQILRCENLSFLYIIGDYNLYDMSLPKNFIKK